MKKNDTVQMIVLVVFGVGIVLGVLFFSGKVSLPGDKNKDVLSGNVTIWGTLPYGLMKNMGDVIEQQNRNLKITYQEKKQDTIQQDFVNALSLGKGPDIIIMAPGMVAENTERLMVIPFSSFSELSYKNTFVESGNDFLTRQGIIALPLFMEPLVLFYNKDLFTDAFLVNPPTTWNQFAEYAGLLTKRDDAGKITQSGTALGTTNNISHVRDLITMKALQNGERFVSFTPETESWMATTGNSQGLFDAFAWYLSFADTQSPWYSWNPSLGKDVDMFIVGKLAMYFGYPFEYENFIIKNPNLNFTMTMIPQSENPALKKSNYARVYSIGVSKMTQNPLAATGVMNLLTQKQNIEIMVNGSYYVPARRDMLSTRQRDNAYMEILYQSAIISKSFFDPSFRETSRLITIVIDSVNNRSRTLDVALSTFNANFSTLVSKIKPPSAR